MYQDYLNCLPTKAVLNNSEQTKKVLNKMKRLLFIVYILMEQRYLPQKGK